ncbi:MAG: hypothetical protein N2246_01095 [Candidatus Sumerlaeia bacterium]|nr:hypothetical protein [Candidatus Sumerlaeia bacterium]
MGCAKRDISLFLINQLPESINGWQPKGPVGIYNAENLYEYIDGAAELYRAFNVKKVMSRQYAKPEAPDIIVDVFEMNSSSDAFGVYHHSRREGENAGIGNESEFIGASLFFWKGRYFVSIIGFEETAETKRTVLELGRKIAEEITDVGHPPELLDFLPLNLGRWEEIYYFHNHHCLNKYYYLSDQNLLRLNQQTEGVLAKYKEITGTPVSVDSTPLVILLLRYISESEAQIAFNNFIKSYLYGANADYVVQTENLRWTAVRCVNNYIICVFDASEKEMAQTIISKISDRINERRDK